NSIEFLGYLKAETPDSLQYLITDMFEKITLYENKATAATYQKLADNKYKVTVTVDAKKLYADSLGTEKIAPLNDWVEIGVLAKKQVNGHEQDVPLYLQKHQVKPGQNKFEVIVSEKPSEAGIDPFLKLIDRNPDDNVKKVTSI
ncbi:MAG: hypothetical protein LPK19_13895, partial [Hymenobacteraceae bacterium]|nr:hypothetical protein [Hymenobacteraceae bacterium]MDX5397317.1 hypothetical protein [Hymenobacteraceae bacterium]MDX5513395.1 hypothetical protein [Hymenobacteraceae bacterium]